MNGKQSKKSRQLQRSIDEKISKVHKELKAQKEINIAEIIALYHTQLYALSFFKRIKFTWRILQCGQPFWTLRVSCLLCLLSVISSAALWLYI